MSVCLSHPVHTPHVFCTLQVRKGLKTFSNWPTFPQLYVNGEFIGGLDIVKVGDGLGRVWMCVVLLTHVSCVVYLHVSEWNFNRYTNSVNCMRRR